MARLSDLPSELQAVIWTLVLPYRGGIHWIEFEGIPHPDHIIHQTLEWTHKLFDDDEPDLHQNILGRSYKPAYRDHYQRLYPGTLFFQDVHATIPSVYGMSKGPLGNVTTQKLLDEITDTQRCRRLSIYTQVTTLLSICRSSRFAASKYLKERSCDGSWPIYRGSGPLHKPRHLNIWKQQYQFKDMNSAIRNVPQTAHVLKPAICAGLDLVVFRLHTASGYPKEVLKHASYQMTPYYRGEPTVPAFDRIGLEWHPLWSTEAGRKELCEEAVSEMVSLIGNLQSVTAQLYWLVDGIPRQQWDQYPAAIPAAFSRVIELRKSHILKNWQKDQAWIDRLLMHHDLQQEFEANGRRYYVVFVLTDWTGAYASLEKSFLDPALDWDGPFPGGESLWPEALHAPVRVASNVQRSRLHNNLCTDQACSYVLSWEPI